MKALLLLVICVATASASTVADRLGLQMYSLRVQTKQEGWKAALDQTKSFGLHFIEGGIPFPGLTIEQSKAELAARGLTIISSGAAYEALTADLTGAVQKAKAAGVKFVTITWIPHSNDTFTEAEAIKAADDFNHWGAAYAAAGISLVYHPHGYEFRPRSDGSTLFDLIVKRTDPKAINFEMDVFWATHGGQNPVELLTKYPDRWKLMHVKDIRKGAPTGIYTGHAPSTDDVAVGSGQVDWPAVLKKAEDVGVKWYFIEDESDTPMKNIPQSIAYIKSLKI